LQRTESEPNVGQINKRKQNRKPCSNNKGKEDAKALLNDNNWFSIIQHIRNNVTIIFYVVLNKLKERKL
jgi:hypothetical protein